MYIGSKRSVLVGMARGRQLRVQPGEFGHFFENEAKIEKFASCHSFQNALIKCE